MIHRSDPQAIAEHWSGPVAFNDTVQCGEGDSVAFQVHGMTAGVVGPGMHRLDLQSLPFLQNAVGSGGGLAAEIWFVRTVPEAGLKIGGHVGDLMDPQQQIVHGVRWIGSVAYQVTDPARFLAALVGVGSELLDIRQLVQSKVLTAVRDRIADFVRQRGSVAALSDAGQAGPLVSAVQSAVNAELGSVGMQVVAIEQSSFQLAASGVAGAPVAVQQPTERTYEMLWDCPHCQQRKNLGLTHRHCPNCGAPQDAQWRYFPADHEKVAVQDHEYVGADLHCPYCGAYNSRRAKHCGGCGAPLEEGQEIRRRQDQLTRGQYAGETQQDARQQFAAGQQPAAAQPPKKRRWIALAVGGGCLTVVLLAVLVAVVMFLWKREGALEVAGHSWKREIEVERFGPVNDSSWCDQMPSGATNVRRAREVRSHKQVQDGQDCRTRRVDRGDGTYVEKQECKPRYRKEPVYDEKCYYRVERWFHARTSKAQGTSLEPEPHWPEVKLSRTGNFIGCERQGQRREEYVVHFVEPSSQEQARCEFNQERWASFQPGSKWTGKLSMLGGVLDCSSLQAR